MMMIQTIRSSIGGVSRRRCASGAGRGIIPTVTTVINTSTTRSSITTGGTFGIEGKGEGRRFMRSYCNLFQEEKEEEEPHNKLFQRRQHPPLSLLRQQQYQHQPSPLLVQQQNQMQMHPQYKDQQQMHQLNNSQHYSSQHDHQRRHMSILPDAIWGGAGYMISTFHSSPLSPPYWACMSLCAITVRTALIPVVLQGARTSAKFASVAPEVQFLMSLFQQDRHLLMQDKSLPLAEKPMRNRQLNFAFLRNMRSLYKKNNVNPLGIFTAPLLQIPIFFYFAADLRGIINGKGDLDLANALQDSGITVGAWEWIPDLTEADPYFVLPIATGALLYLNIELATGKSSLSGETASQANFVKLFRDFFGSVSVLFPCFLATSPAAVQLYLLTSFTFTLGQSVALRNDSVRQLVNLPSLNAQPPPPMLAQKFQNMAQKTRESNERVAKGEQEAGLGKGVLSPFLQTAAPGSLPNQKSTIDITSSSSSTTTNATTATSATSKWVSNSNNNNNSSSNSTITSTTIPYVPSEMMEAANRGDKDFVHLMMGQKSSGGGGGAASQQPKQPIMMVGAPPMVSTLQQAGDGASSESTTSSATIINVQKIKSKQQQRQRRKQGGGGGRGGRPPKKK
jgi:membrane protein insertase Oxa1/YidC/SpoIIIJ